MTRNNLVYLWLSLLKHEHIYSKYVVQDVSFSIETAKFPLFSPFVARSLSYVRVYQSCVTFILYLFVSSYLPYPTSLFHSPTLMFCLGRQWFWISLLLFPCCCSSLLLFLEATLYPKKWILKKDWRFSLWGCFFCNFFVLPMPNWFSLSNANSKAPLKTLLLWKITMLSAEEGFSLPLISLSVAMVVPIQMGPFVFPPLYSLHIFVFHM